MEVCRFPSSDIPHSKYGSFTLPRFKAKPIFPTRTAPSLVNKREKSDDKIPESQFFQNSAKCIYKFLCNNLCSWEILYRAISIADVD